MDQDAEWRRAYGQLVPVLITGAMEYDLVAIPANEPILVM